MAKKEKKPVKVTVIVDRSPPDDDLRRRQRAAAETILAWITRLDKKGGSR